MGSGIKELHRLYCVGDTCETVHPNPGMGDLIILALGVGATVVFWPQIKPAVQGLLSRFQGVTSSAANSAASAAAPGATACIPFTDWGGQICDTSNASANRHLVVAAHQGGVSGGKVVTSGPGGAWGDNLSDATMATLASQILANFRTTGQITYPAGGPS